MSNKVLKVHPNDNVIVALQDIAKGETVIYNGSTFQIVDDIPAKHKFLRMTWMQAMKFTCTEY